MGRAEHQCLDGHENSQTKLLPDTLMLKCISNSQSATNYHGNFQLCYHPTDPCKNNKFTNYCGLFFPLQVKFFFINRSFTRNIFIYTNK